MKVFWKVVNTSSVHFSYSPWIWILSSSPAHILDQQWIYWTRSSSGWFVSRWSYSRPATPQSPPCGLSWHFEDLWTSGLNPRARSPTKFQQMMPDISPWMALKKYPHTNCFQKLHIILLTLQLIFPTERHDAERAEIKKGKEFLSQERSGLLHLNHLSVPFHLHVSQCVTPTRGIFPKTSVTSCKVCPFSCLYQVFPALRWRKKGHLHVWACGVEQNRTERKHSMS